MKNFMTTALIASTLIVASATSFAHNSSFSNDSCSVDLTGGISINAKEMTFSRNKKPLYTIKDNDTLMINGDKVDLTSSQRALLTQYSTRIRAVVPEVKVVALDAIDLAIEGINLAFNELLGSGNKVNSDLTQQLNTIKTEVNNEFDTSKGFYIDENGFGSDGFFGEEFEQRIETAVESTIQNSIGTLMIAIGQEMLFSGGNMDAFETRMEDFGQQIEHEMEARGEKIEKSTEDLCHSAIQINDIEEQLKASIDELSAFDVITVQQEASHNSI